MEYEQLFPNSISLPQELVPLLVDSRVCEYASLKKNGTPETYIHWSPGQERTGAPSMSPQRARGIFNLIHKLIQVARRES